MVCYISQAIRTTKRVLRLALSVAFATVCLTAVPTSLSASGSDNPNDLIIVVNRSVKMDRLTIAQVRSYFLLQKSSWPGGNKAVPFNAKDSRLRDIFRTKVLSMTEKEEQRFWQDQMIRTGKKEPPEVGNVLKAVYHIKGAVSYVFRKDLRPGVVKVVLEIPVG